MLIRGLSWFARESVHDVEAAAEIDCQLFERFIFILQIESVEIAVLAAVIDNPQRNVAGLVAIGIGREDSVAVPTVACCAVIRNPPRRVC